MISLSLKQATMFRILESFDDTLENVRDDKVLWWEVFKCGMLLVWDNLVEGGLKTNSL